MLPPKKDDKHSWSVAIFETHRPSLTEFLKLRVLPLLDNWGCQRILIRAHVKSGKREIVEYLAIRDSAHNPTRVHAFISAFHRTADECQRAELKIHNLHVFPLITRAKADACIKWVADMIAAGKRVVLHLDECDFATGHRQVLSALYNAVHNNINVTTILYSATPQEVLFSGEVEEDEYQGMLDEMILTGEHIQYQPPPSFCGPARFLDEGLVKEATPFFRKTAAGLALTPQGQEIITDLRAGIASGSRRNILVLRLSYMDLGGSLAQKKENKSIYQFLQDWSTIPELAGCLVYADKGEKDIPSASEVLKEMIQWSSSRFWYAKRTDVPIIVVIDQTSSRSTEWACHDRVYAEHDFRNTITFSVISQAQERVNHYEQKYAGFQPIKVYGHLKTFQLSAGRISYKDYMTHEWAARKVDRRTADRLGLVGDYYDIKRTSGDHELHALCPEPVTETEKDRILQEIGCFAKIKVSPRVAGNIKIMPVIKPEFIPCEKRTFSSIKTTLDARFSHNFQNPFIESEEHGLQDGRYKGNLRGWRVLDYEIDVVPSPRWGVTQTNPRLAVCYRAGVIGVALRYYTGETETVNTLETFKSMYVIDN